MCYKKTRGRVESLISQELKILDNNKMLSNLQITKELKFDLAFQCDMELTTVEKLIYKTSNAAFGDMSRPHPVLKCIFELHTEKKSAYVKVLDRNSKVIFMGNSLWGTDKFKTENEFLIFIKRLHDFNTIKKHFDC